MELVTAKSFNGTKRDEYTTMYTYRDGDKWLVEQPEGFVCWGSTKEWIDNEIATDYASMAVPFCDTQGGDLLEIIQFGDERMYHVVDSNMDILDSQECLLFLASCWQDEADRFAYFIFKEDKKPMMVDDYDY